MSMGETPPPVLSKITVNTVVDGVSGYDPIPGPDTGHKQGK